MSNGFAGEAVRPEGEDRVQVEVLGEMVEPDDGDDGQSVAGDENSSSDVDKSIALIANPKFVAQHLVLCFTQAAKVFACCRDIEGL